MDVRIPHRGLQCSVDSPLWAEWIAVAPVGHTLEHVCAPEYFGEQTGSSKLKVGDVIKVRAQDLSWYVELWVRSIDVPLRQVETTVVNRIIIEKGELPSGFDVRYQGPLQRWTIFGEGDLALESGFATHEEAAKRISAITRKRRPAA